MKILLGSMLEKNPNKRIKLKELVNDKWLTENNTQPFELKMYNSYEKILKNCDEVKRPITK